MFVFLYVLQRRSVWFSNQSKAAMNTVTSLETNFPVETSAPRPLPPPTHRPTLPSLFDSAEILNS